VSAFFGWIVHSGVVQGVIIGATLAFLTAIVIMNLVLRRITRTVDGWSSIPACGRPENGVLVRAACAKALPVVNVFEEAAYWTTSRDAAGRRLDGTKTYVLRFPAGQLPPGEAFWSLTATDTVGYMVAGPVDRHSVDDRSGLVPNPDGSVDVVLQATPPLGRELNWLPVPNGRFKLMLRAYLPAPSVIDGTYRVPPVVEASFA
jgi:hypothetical protein